MKKKHIVILLLAIGIVLLLISAILTFMEASKIDIIGGAGLPTLRFVFRYAKNGLYYYLASLGVCSIIASIVVGIVKKKK